MATKFLEQQYVKVTILDPFKFGGPPYWTVVAIILAVPKRRRIHII